MSIYKDKHVKQWTLLQKLRGFFLRTPCDSYIWVSGTKHVCSNRMGHRGKHKDEKTGLSWGYGDEQFGTPAYNTQHKPNDVKGLKACQVCGLSETYWGKWPECKPNSEATLEQEFDKLK